MLAFIDDAISNESIEFMELISKGRYLKIGNRIHHFKPHGIPWQRFSNSGCHYNMLFFGQKKQTVFGQRTHFQNASPRTRVSIIQILVFSMGHKQLRKSFLDLDFSPSAVCATNMSEHGIIACAKSQYAVTRPFGSSESTSNICDPFIDVEGEDKTILSTGKITLSPDKDELPQIRVKEEDADDKPSKSESILVHASAPSSICTTPEEGSEAENFLENYNWRKKILLILRELSLHKKGFLFTKTVKDSDAPGYSEIIKRPVSLNGIKVAIKEGKLCSNAQVHKELLLMILNALTYNPPKSTVHQSALEILSLIDVLFTKLYHEEGFAIKNEETRAAEGMMLSSAPQEHLGLIKKKESYITEDLQVINKQLMAIKEEKEHHPHTDPIRPPDNVKRSSLERPKSPFLKQIEISFLEESVPLVKPEVMLEKTNSEFNAIFTLNEDPSTVAQTPDTKRKRSSNRISSKASSPEEEHSSAPMNVLSTAKQGNSKIFSKDKKQKTIPKDDVNARQTRSATKKRS